MRRTTCLVALIPLLINLVAAQGGKLHLFDFRMENYPRAPRIGANVSRRVLGEVFPKYLAHARYCNGEGERSETDDHLAEDRQSGQIVPSVVDVATGSFTMSGENQTVYLIAVGECSAAHSDNWGTKRIAIFTGNKLVADLDVDFKSRILRKTDLDSDGVNELLLSGGDMNQGIVVQTAALYEFHGGRVRVLQDFERVLEDSCFSGIRGSGIEASVIVLQPSEKGQMPKMHVENYRAACSKVKRWRFVSKGNIPL